MLDLGTHMLPLGFYLLASIPAAVQSLAASPSVAPFTVSMHVEWESANKVMRRPLVPGDELHPWEHFRVHATSDRPVYLYVVETDPARGTTLLFPDDQHTRMRGSLTLPQNGQYRVEGPDGDYTITMFASQHPMTQTQCEMLALRCPLFLAVPTQRSPRGGDGRQSLYAHNSPSSSTSSSESGVRDEEKKAPKKQPEDPPPQKEPAEPAPTAGQSAKDGTRGGLPHIDGKTGIATVQSDANGTAFVTFTFRRRS